MSYHADDYLHEQVDDRDYEVARAQASLARRGIEALTDLVDFSEKQADLEMLNIVKNHLRAMREEVFLTLQMRRK